MTHLTRSSLHRLFQRHGISRLPQPDGDKPKKKFKVYPIGYFHIDIAEGRTSEGKLHMFVAIDRTSRFAFVELHERATRRIAGNFLRHLIEAVPYKIHTVLTDNGTQFTTPGNAASAAPLIMEALDRGETIRVHSLKYACASIQKESIPSLCGTKQLARRTRLVQSAAPRRCVIGVNRPPTPRATLPSVDWLAYPLGRASPPPVLDHAKSWLRNWTTKEPRLLQANPRRNAK